jgi:serine/threonine protein kinase
MKANSVKKYYMMIKKLGEGSFGEVWKAKDRRTNRIVALKFINRNELMSSEEYLKFQNEAGILIHLDHPNVQHIYGIVEEPTRYCLSTSYYEGGTLMDLIDELECFPEKMASQITLNLIKTLTYIHG